MLSSVVFLDSSNRKVQYFSRLSLLFIVLYCCATQSVPSPKKDCPSSFKVYVYDILPSITEVGESARRNQTYHVCKKCIFEQFALEYIVQDYFQQHCGRTNDPAEADYFYLPIIRDLDYRIAMAAGGRNGRVSSPVEQALLNALEKQDLNLFSTVFNITDTYWKRNNGADHIIVMPAPVTNLRHETSRRGFFHYVRRPFMVCNWCTTDSIIP